MYLFAFNLISKYSFQIIMHYVSIVWQEVLHYYVVHSINTFRVTYIELWRVSKSVLAWILNLLSNITYKTWSFSLSSRLVYVHFLKINSLLFQISNAWTFGPQLCDMWTSSDVLCCTASILHLVAIAVDR